MLRPFAISLVIVCLAPFANADPPGTSFSYQGYLELNGQTVTGLYEFSFSVFDAPTGGLQVGTTLNKGATSISEGLFQVSLDFGNSLIEANKALWLSVSLREADSGSAYQVLEPRQVLNLIADNGRSRPLQRPLSGTLTVAIQGEVVNGVDTFFTQEIAVGDAIFINQEIHTVLGIDSDTQLTLARPHERGALSEKGFADGTLFEVLAGDDAEKLKVSSAGVAIGDQGTPIHRIEHGTIGDCDSGSTGNSGAVNFSVPFLETPRVFLTANKGDQGCFVANVPSVSVAGFQWETWGNFGSYAWRQPCRCVYWLALGR